MPPPKSIDQFGGPPVGGPGRGVTWSGSQGGRMWVQERGRGAQGKASTRLCQKRECAAAQRLLLFPFPFPLAGEG